MTAARAAVEILRREGITQAFGLPGAAINPFYRAMRDQGEISHTLARHVEGASHMRAGQTVGGYAAWSCRSGVWVKSGYQRR